MSRFDFSPLYRSAIGFDRLASLMENAASGTGNNGYPPYNIELLSENQYRISMAVAGFGRNELEITSHENTLMVKGHKEQEQNPRNYLYQGIAERGFERRFQLADHIRVVGADLENGLLHIDLVREVPEAAKPRTIAIGQAE
ncbi:heat-shock protein [Zobellella denitrificans]|jgi:molecular chaperone IbpA|uniref:Heat-shock protein n=2 Tax=Zobellella TaxID=347533 RepID=A0A231N115_9GAMM|nr:MULTISPECIES: Hsp20 family protein [Zobellella]ATG75740.1 heat-shock protein [Zobellella denitrificans]OXS16181.1 heat-shock protein [Zobellella denitrificans]PSJ41315.1 heat-shock protein [Zobellella taiwanensis]